MPPVPETNPCDSPSCPPQPVLSPKHAQRLERLTQHSCRVSAEPLLDQRGVDLAEVGRGFEVSLEHEVVEAWRLAVHPALDGASDDEVHLCGAVIGAEARVLRHTPAELAVYVHDDIVGASDAPHLLEETGD